MIRPAGGFRLIHDGRTWTDRQLAVLADTWAASLRPWGTLRHEPVGLVAAPNPGFVVALLALAQLGATPALVPARATPHEAQALLDRAGVERVLATHDAADELAPGRSMCMIDEEAKQPPIAPTGLSAAARPVPGDLVVFTSGTERNPRGILLAWDRLAAHARAAQQRLDLRPDDRWLASLPLGHVGGLALLVRALTLGSTVVLPARGEATDVAAAIGRHEATHASVVPTQLYRWLRDHPGAPPSSLRLLLLGGARAAPDVLDQARRAGLPVRTTYGLTETGSQVATADESTPNGSVGKPLPGVEVRIEPQRGDEPGTGTILVRTAYGMSGTIPPTDQPDEQGWIRTTDLGRMDAGGHLWILGRRSRLIHTAGHKVDPSEVESVLASAPGVQQSAVFGAPDPEYGERVVAAVQATAPADSASWAAHCRSRLAPHKVPRRFLVVAELPLTASGKVRIDALRARLAVDDAHVHVRDAPR